MVDHRREYRMKANSIILNKEERDVIILASRPIGHQHPDNTEIGERLGISVSKVKMLIHQACTKLGANNRIEAKLFALKRGEIKLDELYTFDEMLEFLWTLPPDILRRIAILMHKGLVYRHPQRRDDRIIYTGRRQDTMLTKWERDILILTGRGLANNEIANTLYLSVDTVRKFQYHAYTKLGVSKRADAVLLAAKLGEISLSEMYSYNEILEFLIPLKTESIHKMSQMLEQRLVQEPLLIRS